MAKVITKRVKSKEDSEDLLIFGYSCKLFRDDEKAQTIDEGQHLIPWMGNDSLKIDRYDARGTLYDLSRVEAPPGGFDMFIELTENERAVEIACDEERYRSLHTNEDEDKLYQEEEEKRKDEKAYGQVGYNYEDRKVVVPKEVVEVEEDRPFVPSPILDIPVNMTLPVTMKHNAVIEKTAMFISSQGGQMEIILKAKQTGNPMFDFLTFGNPLHAYYKLVLGYIKSGRYVPNSEPEPPPEPENVPIVPISIEAAPYVASSGQADNSSAYSELLIKLKQKAQLLKKEQEEKQAEEQLKKEQEAARIKQEAERIERLKRDAERIAQEVKVSPPPEVEINIAKMASYAAKNGRSFESVIKKKKDIRFSFLESTNEYHEFYLKKIKSYQGYNEMRNSPPPPPPPPKISAAELTSSNSSKIAPICFAIKPKEAPSIREKSALPEENSDSENEDGQSLGDSTDATEYDLIDGGAKATVADKKLQLERKRKVSAFLRSINVKESPVVSDESSVEPKKVRSNRSSFDEFP